jgi:hypothetical protein
MGAKCVQFQNTCSQALPPSLYCSFTPTCYYCMQGKIIIILIHDLAWCQSTDDNFNTILFNYNFNKSFQDLLLLMPIINMKSTLEAHTRWDFWDIVPCILIHTILLILTSFFLSSAVFTCGTTQLIHKLSQGNWESLNWNCRLLGYDALKYGRHLSKFRMIVLFLIICIWSRQILP